MTIKDWAGVCLVSLFFILLLTMLFVVDGFWGKFSAFILGMLTFAALIATFENRDQ